MSIKISFKKNINDKIIQNYVLFANEQYKINGLGKTQISKYAEKLNQSINANLDREKKFLLFNLKPKQKIIIIKIKKDQSSLENERLELNFIIL